MSSKSSTGEECTADNHCISNKCSNINKCLSGEGLTCSNNADCEEGSCVNVPSYEHKFNSKEFSQKLRNNNNTV